MSPQRGVSATAPPERLAGMIAERQAVLSEFVDREAGGIARACHDMARAFARGATLIPYGTGSAASDAAHAAVEFMHPVIVGKRALPALAPTNDPSGRSDLDRIASAGDIALGLDHGRGDPAVRAFLERARRRGLLSIALGGASEPLDADHCFAVPSDDPEVVQEVQETTYHVLWELVHTFFEQPGLLDDACITCGDVAVAARVVAVRNGSAVIERDGLREEVSVELLEGVEVGEVLLCHAGVALERLERGGDERTGESPEGGEAGFLYPFLQRRESDPERVLADVRASTVRKAEDVIALRGAIDTQAVASCAGRIGERLERGGRLIAFGNGGSSTDAQDLAADALGKNWPAVALTGDVATVTAIGNDVGFQRTFSRQLIPLARPADVAFAITTSGSSANVIAGLEEAHSRGMLTCALAGYDGGRLAELDWLDHLIVVRSDYIPRIQEAQATIYHLVLEVIGDRP